MNQQTMKKQYGNLPVPTNALYKRSKTAKDHFDRVDNPLTFYTLSPEQQNALVAWCEQMEPVKSINRNNSSYGLKHLFEKDAGGFYVTNGQFKGAMLVAGFRVANVAELNWQFNISSKSINRLWKKLIVKAANNER